MTSRPSLKSVKTLFKPSPFFLLIFFGKSEASDGLVNHADGHFAYLKALDISFKRDVKYN